MEKLTRLKVRGYKSIREAELSFSDINILIGANGAGKSNLISLFALLEAMSDQRLDAFVAQNGGMNAFLRYGLKETDSIHIELGFDNWRFELVFGYTTNDNLTLTHTGSGFEPSGSTSLWVPLSVYDVAKDWQAYHFHDLSPMLSQVYVDDNRQLSPDGSNLAAILRLLQKRWKSHYDRITATLRLAFPSFGELDLRPLEENPSNVKLNWRESGRRSIFGPHQFSDGTLRFLALATALGEPPERMPATIVIDEPELGLHPYAISLLGSMIREASHHTQVIVATQSPAFVDEFQPEDVVVVDRHQGDTTFSRLDPSQLTEWLEEYSVGELWEKNVIGGRPSK